MSRSEERWLIVLFLLPTTAFMVLLLWVPFLQGVWMSFRTDQWPFMGEPRWKGLQNYADFMRADYFWTAIRATLIYLALDAVPADPRARRRARAQAEVRRLQAGVARHHDHLLRHAAGRGRRDLAVPARPEPRHDHPLSARVRHHRSADLLVLGEPVGQVDDHAGRQLDLLAVHVPDHPVVAAVDPGVALRAGRDLRRQPVAALRQR